MKLKITKRIAFDVIQISFLLMVTACGNFVLRTGAGDEAKSGDNNVVFYNPTTKYTSTLNFLVFAKEVTQSDVDGQNFVTKRNYLIALKPGSAGISFSATKDFNPSQQFVLALAKSDGAFTDVENLQINVDDSGCLSSITSTLTDKKKEVTKNIVTFGFNVAKIASGIPVPGVARADSSGYVRKPDMDFSVVREFYESDMKLVGDNYEISLLEEIEAAVETNFSKVKKENRPGNNGIVDELNYRIVFEGGRPNYVTMTGSDVLQYLGKRTATTDASSPRVSPSGGHSQAKSGFSLVETSAGRGAEKAVVDGIPYPLPRRISVSVMRSTDVQATGTVTSVDGGGIEILQISAKSFIKRTMDVTFSSTNGLPSVVTYKSGSRAHGASAALAEVSEDIQSKKDELEIRNRSNAKAELDRKREVLGRLKASDQDVASKERKVADLEKEIVGEPDEQKKKALQRQLEDARRDLEYATLERSLLRSELNN